jgi:hypothetical protein
MQSTLFADLAYELAHTEDASILQIDSVLAEL